MNIQYFSFNHQSFSKFPTGNIEPSIPAKLWNDFPGGGVGYHCPAEPSRNGDATFACIDPGKKRVKKQSVVTWNDEKLNESLKVINILCQGLVSNGICLPKVSLPHFSALSNTACKTYYLQHAPRTVDILQVILTNYLYYLSRQFSRSFYQLPHFKMGG